MNKNIKRWHLINNDCIKIMNKMSDNCVNLTLTDIPFGKVNRDSNGLRNLDKGNADIVTFDLNDFLEEVYRVTKGTIIIFCAKEQFSQIFLFFTEKGNKNGGTTRQLIWEKSNPSPMNGQHIYLSGIENAIWFKKRGATFNAYCKNTIFKHSTGKNKIHPTEKNHKLLEELILDNSIENDIIFDPCSGSASTGYVALANNRNFLGIELNKNFYELAKERLEKKYSFINPHL